MGSPREWVPPGNPVMLSCGITRSHTSIFTPGQSGTGVIAFSLPLVVLRMRAEVCLLCAGESGQKDAARRRHLMQAPATPLQLPLTGIGEALQGVHSCSVA